MTKDNKKDKQTMTETELNTLAIKIVSRMVKLKSMEEWFDHVNKTDIAWSIAYVDLELTEEEEALGEAAKLMTLMNMFQEDEEYEMMFSVVDVHAMTTPFEKETLTERTREVVLDYLAVGLDPEKSIIIGKEVC